MKNKRGSVWLWVLIVLILIILGIGVYLFLSNGDGANILNSLGGSGGSIPTPPALPS